jgi:isopenicillin N synthase-like dioxygenase
LFALALDLPEDFFADKVCLDICLFLVHNDVLYWFEQITKPAAIMRLLYYPPQTGIVDDRIIGIGSHTECVK